MIRVVSKIMINASAKQVWNVISAIERDPYFWKGIERVRNTSHGRNVFTREVILSNSDKCYQKVTLFPIEGIHIKWTRGSIIGIKDILVTQIGSQTLLEVEMNYDLKGIAQIRSRNISEELRNEAELALQLIKEDIEKIEPFQFKDRKQWADLIRE
ncbi:MAG TPA: SRPBCC family protein [Candidatus Nitrosotalea sp.]|nr:SRPBCC family protein [Candidatus Nitrosotalea sp.]